MFKKILLFGLIIIVSSIIITSAYEDKFPRVAYWPPYDSNIGAFNPYFAQAVDTLGLTALMQSWGPKLKFPDDYESAEVYHLNLISNATEWYSVGQYSMYQADRQNEPDYFQPPGDQIRFLSTRLTEDNTGHGRQYEDPTANNGYAWFVSKDNPNDNRGYVLYGLWNDPNGIDYTREQDKDSSLTYYAIFQLKVSDNASYQDSDTVAIIGAYLYRSQDTLVWADTLFYEDFTQDTLRLGKYQPFEITFVRPPYDPQDFFDYKVYWYKQTDLYIDYVEVFDSPYDNLFNVKACDTCIQTLYENWLINDSYINDVQNGYGNTSLYRWYLQDEPTYDQFRCSRRVSYLLDSLNYVPGLQAICYLNFNRYLDELDPYPNELNYDDYPIYSLPEYDNIQLQERLNGLAERFFKISDAAKSKGKEWWYIAHNFKGNCTTSEICRYPHNSELKATVYLALAYGAKGIGYYRYGSWFNPNGDTIQGGIVDPIGRPIETYPYAGNNYYSNESETLFTAVRDINKKLDILGPILKGLEWRWAGSGDSVAAAPGSFVASVSRVECEYCTDWDLCKDPTLLNNIQVGMFRDNSKGEDYLMLVNRWVGGGERPCEMVQLQKDRYSYLYDCLSGNFLDTLSGSDAFYVYLLPGEGRLFRLANFLESNLSGSRQLSPQRINLNWSDPNVNESGYEVWRKLADGSSWSPIDSTDSNQTIYYDNNLLGSETYKYKVRAFDQEYHSEFSNEVTVKNFPNPPRNLTARPRKVCCWGYGSGTGSGVGINGPCPYCYTNEIILFWQPPNPDSQKTGTLSQYKVTATGPGLPGGSKSQTVSASYTNMTFCVPELGASYNFVVQAIDNAGDLSNPSNTVNITSGTINFCGDEPAKLAVLTYVAIPEKFELSQNYPNPFNSGTVIKYALPEESKVKLVIYNLLGQKVRTLVDENQSPAYYSVFWNGRDDSQNSLSSGVYFYKISTNKNNEVRKLILVK